MSHLLQVKQPAATRSSKLITLERPSIPSRCKLSNRSFQHAAPQVWNSLPLPFRTPTYSAHLPSLSHVQFHKQLRSEEHTSELQSQSNLVCRLLLEKKKSYVIYT